MNLFQLIIDFGLVVLIWLVQLVIYPSFKYYNAKDLLIWHNIYTKRITIVVMPLMLIQLFISIVLVFQELSLLSGFNIILVGLAWLSTFLIFVPLHQKINNNENLDTSIHKLVSYNWMRTAIWTIVFALSLIMNT